MSPVAQKRRGSQGLGDDLLSHRLGSTIGAAGLNGSVRNGKRWNPRAKVTKNRVTRGQP